MKYVFLGCFVFMGALTAVAWLWQPADNPSKIELLWCSDDNPARREQIELFNELHPKYHLELDPSNNEMTKVIVQCLAGVGPDLFDCYNGFQLGAFVRSGIALDLTEEFARRGIDMDEAWSCTRPVFEYEDRIYGHPENAGANAVWYNKRLFDEAHEPYPQSDWTWAEFIGVAQRLTKRDAQGRLIQLGFVGYWDWQTALVQWGGRIYTPEGTRCVLDSPEGVAAMQFMQDLI
jgi:multiple sugar transport system substrate-binding protein